MWRTLNKLIFIFLLFVTSALADPVTLAWDANNPAPDGYRIFKRIKNSNYNYDNPSWQGQETTCTLDLPCGVIYYFIARAYVNTDESGDSNEVKWASPCRATGIKLSDD